MKNLVILLVCFCLSGCATPYLENTVKWNTLDNDTIYLVSSDPVEKDSRVHKAFIKELKVRNFHVVDMNDKMPETNNGTILEYKESWGWDFVMVISTINVNIIDGKTKNTLGTSYWGRPFFHNYPSPENAVAQVMAEIDLKYVAVEETGESEPVEPTKETDKKCTTDQILKMKEIGMTDDQIRSACN